MMTWLKNTLRNQFRKGMLGNIFQQFIGGKSPRTVQIISATRHTEKTFWKKSALGCSLKKWLSNPEISTVIHFENTKGLSDIYNIHLNDINAPDVLVFVHDDVWLDDPMWVEKVLLSLRGYDIVGVAGNKRILPNQPAWSFHKIENGKFIWDHEFLSGAIRHGQLRRGQLSVFGPTPAECQLIDGVFIAAHARTLRESKIQFDTRFDFHFYDMDFCRTARKRGLSIGTWPIELTHQSGGEFGNIQWETAYKKYIRKWKY